VFRDVVWSRTDGIGTEHLRFVEDETGVTAESVVVGASDGEPFRVRYSLDCDREYRVRRARVTSLGPESNSVSLRADGAGRWTNDRGDEIPALEGCIDVDISVTPFSNTLPIRRIALEPRESVDVSVVYVAVPEMRVEVAQQRYTCLDPVTEDGGRYRYESLSSGFTAELPVDSDGLVVDYPQLFERVHLS
jgi:hypothetical protein